MPQKGYKLIPVKEKTQEKLKKVKALLKLREDLDGMPTYTQIIETLIRVSGIGEEIEKIELELEEA